jgi:hypothetical protein
VDKDVSKPEENRRTSLGQLGDNLATILSYQGDTVYRHFYCVNKQVYQKMWTTLWASAGISVGKVVQKRG